MRSIASKLIAAFLLVIIGISAMFSLVGVQFIGSRIVAEAQAKVRTDLNSAREMYLANLGKVHDIVRFTADRFSLRNAVLAGDLRPVTDELSRLRTREKLDVLTVLDHSGKVLLRAGNPARAGDDQSRDEMAQAVFLKKEPVAATSIVPAAHLAGESADLVERARFVFIETPRARPRTETEETSGMMLRDLLQCATAGLAHVIATVCPLCQINLEFYQKQVNREFGTRFALPVLFFTQLLGLALGIPPGQLGIGKEVVPATPVLSCLREEAVLTHS